MEMNYEKLDVIHLARKLTKLVYSLTSNWPREEIYSGGLANQARRASVSIVLNIAEGSAGTKKDFARFIRIASRSVLETRECFVIGLELKYNSKEELDEIKEQAATIFFKLAALRKAIEK